MLEIRIRKIFNPKFLYPNIRSKIFVSESDPKFLYQNQIRDPVQMEYTLSTFFWFTSGYLLFFGLNIFHYYNILLIFNFLFTWSLNV